MKENFNSKNLIIKKKYFEYLKEAKQLSASTVNSVATALNRYEDFINYEGFEKFNAEKAKLFKKHIAAAKSKVNKGQLLSKSTLLHTLNPLKEFFRWLASQAGYKSKINYMDIEYLNLSEKDTRAAKSSNHKEFPSIEQIKKVIFSINPNNEIERRNQALIAFVLLTGARGGAVISLKLKHIDVEKKLVKQNPKEVETKFSKQINSYFFPVGEDVENVFINWVKYLNEVKLFSPNSPLFPKTGVELDGENCFSNGGLSKEPWQSIAPLQGIFKKAFNDAGFEYYNPHSFRNTLVQYGEQICKTPEEFKAWSQNLGHESPLITFNSYGQVSTHRQGDIIKGLGNRSTNQDKIEEILNLLKR